MHGRTNKTTSPRNKSRKPSLQSRNASNKPSLKSSSNSNSGSSKPKLNKTSSGSSRPKLRKTSSGSSRPRLSKTSSGSSRPRLSKTSSGSSRPRLSKTSSGSSRPIDLRGKSKVNSRSLGKITARVIGSPNTGTGSNVADTTVTAFLTTVTVATLVRITRSVSTAFPKWLSVVIRVSSMRVFGSASSTHGQKRGQTIGTTTMMCMSFTPMADITCTTTVTPASDLHSASIRTRDSSRDSKVCDSKSEHANFSSTQGASKGARKRRQQCWERYLSSSV